MRKLCFLIGLLLLTGCTPTDLLISHADEKQLTVQTDIPYEDGARHTLDIYQPRDPAPGHPVVVFFYGGEWKFGSKEQYRFVADSLAARGITTVLPDYRIYPPTPFPGFIEDSAAAVVWVHQHIADYGGSPNSLFLSGHSAGAYNAVMLALDPHYLKEVGMKPADLRGVIGLAGPYDFLPITWPELKPIFEVAPDLKVTQPITYADGANPPLLLLAGADDTTVRPRNTLALADKITAHGGDVAIKLYPDTAHIGIVLDLSSVFQDRQPVLDDMIAFMTAHTKPD